MVGHTHWSDKYRTDECSLLIPAIFSVRWKTTSSTETEVGKREWMDEEKGNIVK